jgi:hypothetical protein
MIRLESFDLLGAEGHGDRVFDFCFPLRGRRSLWRCVVGGVGTIVVRGKLVTHIIFSSYARLGKIGVLLFLVLLVVESTEK